MAAFFTADELSALRSRGSVRYATLVHMQFSTAPELRLMSGPGIRDFGGHTWTGLGTIGQIDGLGDQRGTTSNPVTFTLSGVDERILPLAFNDTDEVDQQPITVPLQLLDDDEQPVGRLIGIFHGLMQPPAIDRAAAGDGEGAVCTVSLQAENFLVGKSKPPNGRYTAADQRAEFPDDALFDRVAENRNKTIKWFDF